MKRWETSAESIKLLLKYGIEYDHSLQLIKSAFNSHGFVNARDVESIWKDHFDYFYREYDEFVFTF